MRLIEIHTPLLDANCIALGFKVKEQLSAEPHYELELVSPDADLDLDRLLGEAMTISIDLGDGTARTFHCHVFAGYDTGQMDDKFTYSLELASWLSFLGESRNSRIFQLLTVQDIVTQVFAAHHYPDFRFELTNTLEVREYCVQFQESDLHFVKRLLEDEGIYFWVEHEADRHVIVLSDHQRFEDLPGGYATMRFLPDGEEQRAIDGREGIQRLQRARRVRPTHVALRDFNYHLPSSRMDTAHAAQQEPQRVALEHYDYATGFADVERGGHLARLRFEALEAQANQLSGRSNARGLAVGRAFTLEGHPDAERNSRYFVTRVEQLFAQDGPDSASSGRNVGATFNAMPDNRPFRPARTTPSPQVPGIQSATVVGPAGSEVHTDRLGRIRVHFHWDRYKTTEEDASCWIRVSQAWAGKGWGVLALPRVGQEVLVSYVDGDLDRPLVTGIVYNGENPTPYDLPKDIRYTGIVTRSLREGQFWNASQLTFDDQRGAERVMIHSERDMQRTVERNDSTSVGQDKNTMVAGTDTSTTENKVNYDSVKVDIAGINTGINGIKTEFNGINTEFNGVNTEFIGVSTEFTGVKTEFTGVETEFVGVNTGFTGVSTEFTGIETSITGVQTECVGVEMHMAGIATSIEGVSTEVIGQSMSIIGTELEIVGTSTSIVGHSTEIKGEESSKKGSVESEVGEEEATVGSRRSTVGDENVVTGRQSSHSGYVMEVVGTRQSTTGSSMAQKSVEVATFGIQIKN